MPGIDSYFSGTRRSRVKLFEKVSKEKSKKKRRRMEERFLKPYVIPEYDGKLPGYNNPVESRKVMIIFDSEADLNLFRKFFKVSSYKGFNVRDVSLLLLFLDALENGSLEYDKEERKINFVGDTGERIPL